MGTIDRQPGSSRPHSVHVNENIENVEDFVLHQEDNRMSKNLRVCK